MVIFGAGDGFEAPGRWLNDCAIHDRGKIDTHGFAILNPLRMDQATLQAHADFWGTEHNPLRADLPRLNATAVALFDALRHNRFRPNLRLEQEHLGFGWVVEKISKQLCLSDKEP